MIFLEWPSGCFFFQKKKKLLIFCAVCVIIKNVVSKNSSTARIKMGSASIGLLDMHPLKRKYLRKEGQILKNLHPT